MANFAFIDSQSINLGVRSLGWKLDWRRFRVYLRDKYDVVTAFSFIGFMAERQPGSRTTFAMPPSERQANPMSPVHGADPDVTRGPFRRMIFVPSPRTPPCAFGTWSAIRMATSME
jgi:hypothetical protein